MTAISPRRITLGQFTTVFVPAGLLLVFALIAPELGGDLNVGRTRLTMWPPILLLIPALVLYIFRETSLTVANLSHLFWTAALVAFIVHVSWGALVFYDGVADVFRNQGLLLASANYTLLIIWMLDTLVLWFGPRHRYSPAAHTGIRAFVFASFSLDLLLGRSGTVHALGFLLVGVSTLAVLIRFGMSVAARAVPEEEPTRS